MNTTNGIIAERSKEAIASAMLEVMKIYSYDEITVTDNSGGGVVAQDFLPSL